MPQSLAEGIPDLYERHAEYWDKERTRVTSFIERHWLELFLETIEPPGTILDLGCGGGTPIASYLIESGYKVTGIDTSPTLIQLARSRFPEQTWIVGNMLNPPIKDKFSGIIAWDSFFHLTPDNQRGMFAIFREYSAPGAALLFTSGSAAGVAIGSMAGDQLYHASLDADEYRELLINYGFSVRWQVENDPTCGGHTIWLADFCK